MAIQQITIRIPRRTSATGPFTLEWYAWRDSSLQLAARVPIPVVAQDPAK